MKTLRQLITEESSDDSESFLNKFSEGFKEELEHKSTVGGDMITVAKIVLDHLAEDSEYYSKLEKAGLTESNMMSYDSDKLANIFAAAKSSPKGVKEDSGNLFLDLSSARANSVIASQAMLLQDRFEGKTVFVHGAPTGSTSKYATGYLKLKVAQIKVVGKNLSITTSDRKEFTILPLGSAFDSRSKDLGVIKTL